MTVIEQHSFEFHRQERVTLIPKPHWSPDEVLRHASYLDPDQALQPPLTDTEIGALTKLVNRTRREDFESVNTEDFDLRFDITQAADRQRSGQVVSERHLALNAIFRHLDNTQSTLVDNRHKPRGGDSTSSAAEA